MGKCHGIAGWPCAGDRRQRGAEQLVNVNNSAEIWNPATGAWTIGASGTRARLYHSVALLLPDGSVLVGGGGAAPDAPVNNLHSEIYYPPYLYDAPGHFASRPSISSAPDTLTAGQTFTVGADTADIQRVTLVKTGAVTHSFNMDQRFVELAFTGSGGVLSVHAPSRATDTPPGYYLLFVINGAGTPSNGRIVRVRVGEAHTVAPTTPAEPCACARQRSCEADVDRVDRCGRRLRLCRYIGQRMGRWARRSRVPRRPRGPTRRCRKAYVTRMRSKRLMQPATSALPLRSR